MLSFSETLPQAQAAPRSFEAFVEALRARDPWAERALLEDFTPNVAGILHRLLGGGADLDDLTQEAFIRVLSRIDDLRDPAALPGFVTSTTVYVAREAI